MDEERCEWCGSEKMAFKIETTSRGFRYVTAPVYAHNKRPVVAQESSAVGDYDDADDKPGSSFLWIGHPDGPRAHLNREEVADLIKLLETWLATGRLDVEEDP